ncbi:hypothetical protein ACF07V_08105 [Streptomyces sp. NPDC015661]|uniref:hypothetical protein n=1 Tax=Streptomyces sp. NPDC015661 TaxID=3364961 RepID=UPI0036FD2F6C
MNRVGTVVAAVVLAGALAGCGSGTPADGTRPADKPASAQPFTGDTGDSGRAQGEKLAARLTQDFVAGALKK